MELYDKINCLIIKTCVCVCVLGNCVCVRVQLWSELVIECSTNSEKRVPSGRNEMPGGGGRELGVVSSNKSYDKTHRRR